MNNLKDALIIVTLTAGLALVAGFFVGISIRVAAFVINF